MRGLLALFAAASLAAGPAAAAGAEAEADSLGWAIPHVSAAHVRSEPRHEAEMVTQALMGWPVRVLLRLPDQGWSRVELPDGYRGYIIDNSLTFVDSAALRRWEASPRAIATASWPLMGRDAEGRAVADFVQGAVAAIAGGDSVSTLLRLPDGRECWLPAGACMPLDRWRRRSPDPQRLLDGARALTGVPYLWGGLTAKGMDCSGLTRLAYLAEGIMLPRDASQQALAGEPVARPDDAAEGTAASGVEPADLLFFASEATGRINHVALYAGDGTMIECAGRVRVVAVPWQRVAAIRRYIAPAPL